MADFTLRWGIVGTGPISQDFVSALHAIKTPGHELTAVGARHLADAQSFATRFKVTHACEYDALFSHSDVNIVYVGTTHIAHKEHCLKAIAAGKHVLCEKPMSLNVKDQEQVLAAAKDKGVFFMEAIWTRFFPVIDRLREELAKKTVGEVNFFSGALMVPISFLEKMHKPELAGGATYAVGIYPIQLACLAFNHEEPVKITATGHLLEGGTDGSVTVVLLYSSNRMAQINYSIDTFVHAPAFIIGNKGILQIPEYSWSPETLILPDKQVIHEPLPEPHEDFKQFVYDHSVALSYEAEAVRVAISKGLTEHPNMTHAHSRLIMRIMEEALKQLGYKHPQ